MERDLRRNVNVIIKTKKIKGLDRLLKDPCCFPAF
jgi:hypothetical protein